MKLRWGAVMICVVLAAACDDRTTVAEPPGPLPSGVAPEAASKWAQFPADRTPRPVVVLDELPLYGAFTDATALEAFKYGRYAVAPEVPLPPAPAKTVAVTLPGQPAAQLPALGAQEALTALRNARPRNVASDGAGTGTVRVTAVTYGTAMFRTDRGDASLPAWVFTVEGSSGPVLWPALAADGLVQAPAEVQNPPLGPATARGTTVTVHLPAPAPACPGQPEHRYEPVVVESPRVVAIGLRAVVRGTAAGPADAPCGHTAMLRTAQYEMRLTTPLGPRLLVDADGTPLQVTQG